MIFTHPEFLWGLLVMLIPIFIHLFDFRKNRKVYFSDIRFLKVIKHSSKKPLKLKRWLILLSRLAFLFFLVMMFAQPVIPTTSKKQLSKGVKLIYIDNSQSMSAMVNSKETALERAKLIAGKVLDQFPKGQEVVLLNNDNLYQFITGSSISETSDKIAALGYSDKQTSINQVGLAINEYQKRISNIGDVFIASDFQKSTNTQELNNLDSSLNYWLSPVEVEKTNNCVVDSVFLIDSNISIDGNVKIEVIIRNYGNQIKENLPVKVFLGSRQVSAASITIPAFQKKSISFSLGKVDEVAMGYIQIEDYPNTFDNNFNFSIGPNRGINIFEIAGEQASPYVETVFGNGNLFNYFSNNFQNIDNSLFDKANFVILNELKNPESELIIRLKDFATNGGSVLVIPPIDFNSDSYRALSTSLSRTINYRSKKLKTPLINTPFFTGMLEKSGGKVEMPNATPVWFWGNDRSAILSFEDGAPYLSEISRNIFVLSTPLIDTLSDFQSHAIFVPVMYRLASKSIAPSNQLFSRIEREYFEVQMDSIHFRDLIKLTKDELEIIPEKNKVGNNWRLSFPKEIRTTGGYKIELDNLTKGYLAINLAQEESRLDALNKEELSSLFARYNINFLEEFNPNSTKMNSFDNGIVLWKYALTFCLLFLLLETLFIRFL